ncbi:MAG TPA: endolytic transglycosylase MltG [Granulicella sp.]|nr:endolytic transglycosylase MltG [Granulicella sp.]
MLKLLGFLLLLSLIALAVLYSILYLPYGPHAETFVDIAPGTSALAIGDQLQRSGIIRSRYGFDLTRAWKAGTLKAGEYRFDHPVPLTEVYDRLLRGDVYTRALTIPEGYNIFDISRAVEAAGLGSRQAFLAAEQQHTELIANLSPHATSLEGYLFPDTYRFSRHATPEQMLATMVRRFRQEAAQLGLSQADTDLARTVTLASLVEKEVNQDSERPLVAGVFLNRLAQKMPLATDPTVIYSALLEDRYRGAIYASDLQSPSAYNTYRHTGLPPGPISNPGVAALRAAIAPAKTDYLYFVSDDNGHSRFAASLKEHAAQVQQYRQAERAAGRR